MAIKKHKKKEPVPQQATTDSTTLSESNFSTSAAQKSNRNIKARNWTLEVYPESAPDNWKEELTKTGLAWSCILHDQDCNPDGEIKKAHYHVIVCYEGPTTFNSVKNLQRITNGPIPLKLESVIGMYRYFTHKDNPEKFQYDPADIECYNGFEVPLASADVRRIKSEINMAIIEQGITEYLELILYCGHYMGPEYEDVASNHTVFYTQILRGMRHNPSKIESMINRLNKEAAADECDN